jgi:DNA-binding NarL/FixJ family response regulator
VDSFDHSTASRRQSAQGMTNKEIAACLVISRRTAESQVVHILDKLGFSMRAQIATWLATRQR